MTQTIQVHPNSGITNAYPASVETWTEELELVTEQDRDFFLQHPAEEFYIRAIAPVEILEAKSMGRFLDADGFMLVGQVAPGCRTRLFFANNQQPPLSSFREMKKQFRHQLGKKSTQPNEPFKSASKARPKAKGFG